MQDIEVVFLINLKCSRKGKGKHEKEPEMSVLILPGVRMRNLHS